MAEADTSRADERRITRDALFGGRLLLEQPASGHRVGTDAVLLASAVPPDFAGRVYDLGAGVGAVGLAIALASPDATVTLIENDPTCVRLAEANIAANGLPTHARVADCDVLAAETRRAFAGAADLVVTNPPFYRASEGRGSPDLARRAAHMLAPGGLEAWLQTCLALLAPKGTLVLIHPAASLPELLGCLEARLGGLAVLPVHPRAGQPASRVLVRGSKGSRAPFRLAAPLILHGDDGFTPEAARLHAGMASLVW